MNNFSAQQLYKDSVKLMTLSYEAQFCMTNADRIGYGNDFKQDCRRLVSLFVLAWGNYTKRVDLIDEYIATLANVQVLFRWMNQHNIIKLKKGIAKDDPSTETQNPDRIKNEIADAIARVDVGTTPTTPGSSTATTGRPTTTTSTTATRWRRSRINRNIKWQTCRT